MERLTVLIMGTTALQFGMKHWCMHVYTGLKGQTQWDGSGCVCVAPWFVLTPWFTVSDKFQCSEWRFQTPPFSCLATSWVFSPSLYLLTRVPGPDVSMAVWGIWRKREAPGRGAMGSWRVYFDIHTLLISALLTRLWFFYSYNNIPMRQDWLQRCDWPESP